MYSPASQICEKKEGARKLPFLRNILHNAGKWEGRNNWEMGKRSSSKLWLSIIFLLCRCLCCLALAPGPDHTPGSVITALLTVMCMPCLCPKWHVDFIILKCSYVQSVHGLGLQYLLPDMLQGHHSPEIFHISALLSKQTAINLHPVIDQPGARTVNRLSWKPWTLE